MIHAAVVIAYLGSLLFMAFVLAGTVWLIGWHDWSVWWMLFSSCVCGCVAPTLEFRKTTKSDS